MIKFGYLSGAPRASTLETAENAAVRNHIHGIMSGFSKNGIQFDEYIIGNELPVFFSGKGSEGITNRSKLSRLISDIIRIIIRYISPLFAYRRLGKQLDFVYEQYGLMQALGYKFKRKGIPWILETHAILYEEAHKESKTLYLYRLARRFEKFVYEKSDVIVCISESLKVSIHNEFKIPSKKIYVMPNGVDLTVFKSSVSDLKKRNEEQLVIGYVGALIKWQSLDILLSSVSVTDLNVKLVIVGDGPEEENLKSMAVELGIADKVDFVGRVKVDKVPDYIKQFHVGYCNPIHELDSSGSTFNSPMKIYEYLAMGVPVLSPELPEYKLINDSENFTHIFDARSVDSLHAVIENLYQMRRSLLDQGIAAMKEIEENHSWEGRIKNFLDFLKENKVIKS